MDLSSRVVRDAATEVPEHYSPPDLFTGALQHTDPSLTWDETDKRRKKVGVTGWGWVGDGGLQPLPAYAACLSICSFVFVWSFDLGLSPGKCHVTASRGCIAPL
jgi:hypothetical protein